MKDLNITSADRIFNELQYGLRRLEVGTIINYRLDNSNKVFYFTSLSKLLCFIDDLLHKSIKDTKINLITENIRTVLENRLYDSTLKNVPIFHIDTNKFLISVDKGLELLHSPMNILSVFPTYMLPFSGLGVDELPVDSTTAMVYEYCNDCLEFFPDRKPVIIYGDDLVDNDLEGV